MRSHVPCPVCGKDTHDLRSCPQLPIVKLADADAPLVGFRSWKRGKTRLRSYFKDVAWNAAGPTKAMCDLHAHHQAPALRCTCGMYACHSLRDAALHLHDPEFVAGAVLGWGRVFLHENGWRAEYAQVLCLTSIGAPRPEDVAAALALSLPLVPGDAVERYALEFGVAGSALYRAG